MGLDIIQNKRFLSNLNKSFTEGVYADTYQNRKLGRVGMTYSSYAAKVKKEQEGEKEEHPLYLELANQIAKKVIEEGKSIDLWGTPYKTLINKLTTRIKTLKNSFVLSEYQEKKVETELEQLESQLKFYKDLKTIADAHLNNDKEPSIKEWLSQFLPKSEYQFNEEQLGIALDKGIYLSISKRTDLEFTLSKESSKEEKDKFIEAYKDSNISKLDFIELSSYIEKEAKELMNSTDYPIDESRTIKTIDIDTKTGICTFKIIIKSKDFTEYDEESGEELSNNYHISLFRTFTKTYNDKLICNHEEFDMSPVYQKKGLSKKILKKLFEEYEKMGVDEVHMCANMEIGGYCWAKYGFMANLDQIYPIMEEGLQDGNISKGEKQEIIKLVLDNYKQKEGTNVIPMNLIANLPYGFRLLKGSSWQGFMDLHDEDQMRIFYDYLN